MHEIIYKNVFEGENKWPKIINIGEKTIQ
jgi:hypothetical protein